MTNQTVQLEKQQRDRAKSHRSMTAFRSIPVLSFFQPSGISDSCVFSRYRLKPLAYSTSREDGERMFRRVSGDFHSLDAVLAAELVVMPVQIERRVVVGDPRRNVARAQIYAANLLRTGAGQRQVYLVHRLHCRVHEQQEVVFQSI